MVCCHLLLVETHGGVVDPQNNGVVCCHRLLVETHGGALDPDASRAMELSVVTGY